MRKTLVALAAVSTLAISAVAPAPAHAQRGVGAAIAGGIIGGAIVGGALAGPRYYGPGYGYYGPGYGYYGPGYSYYGGPAYVAAPVVRATGSASVSGTAMAGAFATSGFAAEPVHLH